MKKDYEFAQLVVDQIFRDPRLLIPLILFVGCSLGIIYISTYLKKKGENQATREDFYKLRDQIRDSTRDIEIIKNDVAHGGWARREWIALHLRKLEELSNHIHDCDEFLTAAKMSVMEGIAYKGHDPLENTLSISLLYFPDLYTPVHHFVQACRTYRVECNKVGIAVLRGGSLDLWDAMDPAHYDAVLETRRVAVASIAIKLASYEPQ